MSCHSERLACHSERLCLVIPNAWLVIPNAYILSFQTPISCHSERLYLVIPNTYILSFQTPISCHSERSEESLDPSTHQDDRSYNPKHSGVRMTSSLGTQIAIKTSAGDIVGFISRRRLAILA
jgi:hypothetical protein